jgi:phosphoribosylformylglycinamidine cyclo-ligase
MAAACPPARLPVNDGDARPMQAGGVAEDEMFRTFNMGIGMLVVVGRASADAARAADPDALVLGEVVAGRGVQLV